MPPFSKGGWTFVASSATLGRDLRGVSTLALDDCLSNCALEIEPQVSIRSLIGTDNFRALSTKLVELLQTFNIKCGELMHILRLHNAASV